MARRSGLYPCSFLGLISCPLILVSLFSFSLTPCVHVQIVVHSIGAALHVVGMFVWVFVQVWDMGALASVGCFGGKFVGLRVLLGAAGHVLVMLCCVMVIACLCCCLSISLGERFAVMSHSYPVPLPPCRDVDGGVPSWLELRFF